MSTTSYDTCPLEIFAHIIPFLTHESKMALYFADPFIRPLFPIVSDVKTALKNNDIVNLRRLSETMFPIDKETYVLACASGVMEFIKLLETREPKIFSIYSTDIHGCISWSDAGLIEAIKNNRVNVVRKLMTRKVLFHYITNYRIVRAGLLNNNSEIMGLINRCYQEVSSNHPDDLYDILIEAAYITNNMSLIDKAVGLNCTSFFGYTLEYYRARYTGQYTTLNAKVLLGLCACKVSNILETEYIDPVLHGITARDVSEELGIGGNVKTIRNFMKHSILHPIILHRLCRENKEEDIIDILKEIAEHWNTHGVSQTSLTSVLMNMCVSIGLNMFKLLLTLFFELPDQETKLIFTIIRLPLIRVDERKDRISFLIDHGGITITAQQRIRVNMYIEESGDEDMKRLLDRIPEY